MLPILSKEYCSTGTYTNTFLVHLLVVWPTKYTQWYFSCSPYQWSRYQIIADGSILLNVIVIYFPTFSVYSCFWEPRLLLARG